MNMASGIKENELRIVLVGKTGTGKSATGNSILGTEGFKSVVSPAAVTQKTEKKVVVTDGRKIVVVDTPGFFDPKVPNDKMSKEVKKCVKFSYPGPQAIIQVMQLGRFSTQEKEAAQLIQKVFNFKAKEYMILLFTRKEDLKGRSLQDFLREGDEDLQEQLAQCGGRYLAFNNGAKGQEREAQVAELLEMIDGMVERNSKAPSVFPGDAPHHCPFQLHAKVKDTEPYMILSSCLEYLFSNCQYSLISCFCRSFWFLDCLARCFRLLVSWPLRRERSPRRLRGTLACASSSSSGPRAEPWPHGAFAGERCCRAPEPGAPSALPPCRSRTTKPC